MPAHKSGKRFNFKLAGVNDANKDAKGKVETILLDSKGKEVFTNTKTVVLPASGRIKIPLD